MSFFQIIAASANIKNYGAVSDGTTDDIVAINQALQTYDVIYFEDNTTTIVGSAIVIPSNKTIILGSNAVIKLKSGASDYIMRNSDFTNGNQNITIVGMNIGSTIDGNEPGGQTRDYSTSALTTTSWWGMGLWFVRTKNLQIRDLTIKDTDGWGIGHYDCPYSLFENIRFDQGVYNGNNGDGITGFSSHVTIRNISGYTNDDMIFIGAGGGSVKGNDMGLPAFDIDNILIENIYGEQKNGSNTFRGVRVSGREEKRIKNITIRNVKGHFKYECVEIKNFWTGNLFIDNITIQDIFRYSKSDFASNTILIGTVTIGKLLVSDVYANPLINETLVLIESNVIGSNFIFENVEVKDESGLAVTFIYHRGDVKNFGLNNIFMRTANTVVEPGYIFVINGNGKGTKVRFNNCRTDKVNDAKRKIFNNENGALSVSGISDYVDKTNLYPQSGDVIMDVTDGLQYYNGTSWV